MSTLVQTLLIVAGFAVAGWLGYRGLAAIGRVIVRRVPAVGILEPERLGHALGRQIMRVPTPLRIFLIAALLYYWLMPAPH